jgi:hypothetical protein
MDQDNYICISKRLLDENWCWKSKYLKTLIEVAFKTKEKGYYLKYYIRRKPRIYLESKEQSERRQSFNWLRNNGFVKIERMPAPRNHAYKVTLTDFAKQFIKIEEG